MSKIQIQQEKVVYKNDKSFTSRLIQNRSFLKHSSWHTTTAAAATTTTTNTTVLRPFVWVCQTVPGRQALGN